MSESFTSVWDEAGDSAEAEQGLRALTAARVEAAAYWPFLSAAANREDFVNRLALKDEEIATAAERQGITFEALVRSLAEDFHAVEAARVEAKEGCDHEWAFNNQCKKCGEQMKVPTKESARHLAIFKVTAADDSSAYYVVDEDTDKKVGGPYDDEAGARAAISGGDVEGDNLTVSKGGGGDDDGDDDSDDKKSPPKDDDDSDDDKDDSDKDDSDDGDDKGKKGNPFAKKDATRKVAHPGFGMGMDEEVDDHEHSGGQHPTPTITPHDHKVVMKMREDSRTSRKPDMMCDGCGGSFDSRSMHHMDKNCPHCGADPSYHNDADDYDDQDPHYGGDYGHSEDNYGDPYGKFDEGGAWDQHRHGSLFPVIALQEGEDPLEWVAQSVPSGEGEPERPDEHLENLVLTGSLIDRFSQVFTATLGS